MCRRTRDTESLITEAGLTIVSLRRGKHNVYRLRGNADETGLLVVPCSASDHRAVLNLKSELRRLAAALNPSKGA